MDWEIRELSHSLEPNLLMGSMLYRQPLKLENGDERYSKNFHQVLLYGEQP
jgi:hypothetical protein